MTPACHAFLVSLCAAIGTGAQAADISVSGFGTVGYSRSNQDFTYERFIDNNGTFKRDTLFGLQMDARFSPQFGATVQGRLAPSTDSDRGWKTSLAWAFLSWRPNNDWLLRAGKLRVPGYMNSENMNVGATFDYARLPTEMYSITPTMDFTGALISRYWRDDDNELTLDAYVGKTPYHWRYYYRQSLLDYQQGAYYMPIELKSGGAALTLRRDEDTYRIGYHFGDITRQDERYIPNTFPYVNLLPGIGFYQVDNRLPGPGLDNKKTIGYSVFYLGADVALPEDFRGVAEYGRRNISKTDIGPSSQSLFLSVLKRIGAWTPYVNFAKMRSDATQRQLYAAVNGSQVPSLFPGSDQLNAAQHLGADNVSMFDQQAWSFGASYALSPTSKLKGELSRVHFGEGSSFIDTPASGPIRNQSMNMLTVAYSFVF
jgi:hypothetical protein